MLCGGWSDENRLKLNTVSANGASVAAAAGAAVHADPRVDAELSIICDAWRSATMRLAGGSAAVN